MTASTLTMLVEMLTFSMSPGLAGVKSGGNGSWGFSPSFPGSGLLFFFSLVVGGWRRDCDRARFALVPASSAKTSVRLKNESQYLRALIAATPRKQAEEVCGPFTLAGPRFSTVLRKRAWQLSDAQTWSEVYYGPQLWTS